LGQSQVLVTEDYVRIVAHGTHTVANLYNMEGKVVASTLIAQGAAMLSTDGLATGVYTLSLEGSAQVESLQLFID
ncbi:MAG: T9SS type A sorting domain-containing protein, partial [Chitinophagales bacterium]